MAAKSKKPPAFDPAERARSREEADRRVRALYAQIRNHDDPNDPSLRAWRDASATYYGTIWGYLPSDFLQNLGRVRQGDVTAVSPMVDFLATDPWNYTSGYLKADVIRYLKRLALPPAQQHRLRQVVLQVLDKGDRREFRHYCKLARKVRSPQLEADIQRRFDGGPPDLRRRAGWLLSAIRQKP